MDTFKTLPEAEAAHIENGGILLVLDDGQYGICTICDYGRCKCRSRKWIKSLAPSWSEAAPENMTRDPRGLPIQSSLL